MNSHLQTPETFWLCNQVLGIQGTQNISPKLTIPRSSCIHPSTHNQETFGNRLPQPSKSIRCTSYGNTPALASVLGYQGYLTKNCTKEIFDVGVLTQVFQNRNDKIMTTTPRRSTPRDTSTKPLLTGGIKTMLSSQNHRNDSKIPA